MDSTFNALLCTRENDQHSVESTSLTHKDLPDLPILIQVDYSTLNYKDALAITGAAPIIRKYPMVAGIDLAGTVVESDDEQWPAGTPVLVNGYGLGEAHWGGYSRYARMKPEWLVRIPDGLDARQAMGIGTAGYTSMLSVLALQQAGIEKGNILVSGAAGGVGSIAVALLASLGYNVIASSRRTETEGDYLRNLGASELLPNSELEEKFPPLGKERWDGAIDSVGSKVLAHILTATSYGGAVAACGLAGGADLPTSVMPFILRGVKLLGIDSVMAPMSLRQQAWQRLATDLDTNLLESMVNEYPLKDVPQLAPRVLQGEIRGRCIISLN